MSTSTIRRSIQKRVDRAADIGGIRTAKSDPRERHFVQANAGSANQSGSTALQTIYQEAAVVRPRRLKFTTAGPPLVFQVDPRL